MTFRPSIPNDCYRYPIISSYGMIDPVRVRISGRVRSPRGWMHETIELVCPLARVATIKHCIEGMGRTSMVATPLRK